MWLLNWVLKAFWRLDWRVRLVTVVCLPLLVLNATVAFIGHTVVFPLSPFFLSQKVGALEAYAKHRPTCLLSGHGDVEGLARRAEGRYHLPRGLMRAVVYVESHDQPHRISPAGAMGPAQLVPSTAAMLHVRDPFEPEESIDAGARYLSSLLHQFKDVRLAVAAYNAGPGAVHGQVPQNGETEMYVARVMNRYAELRRD
jgi:soluble lytic murein transglycosylase-like protein